MNYMCWRQSFISKSLILLLLLELQIIAIFGCETYLKTLIFGNFFCHLMSAHFGIEKVFSKLLNIGIVYIHQITILQIKLLKQLIQFIRGICQVFRAVNFRVLFQENLRSLFELIQPPNVKRRIPSNRLVSFIASFCFLPYLFTQYFFLQCTLSTYLIDNPLRFSFQILRSRAAVFLLWSMLLSLSSVLSELHLIIKCCS